MLRSEATKHLLPNTGMLAEVALAEILETVMRFFATLRMTGVLQPSPLASFSAPG